MYPWNGSWHSSRVPVAWGPLQFQLQNICSRGDELVALVLPVLSWCMSPSGVYVSQSPKSTALAVQGKPGGIVVPEDLYGLGYTYGYRFPSGPSRHYAHTHTGSVWAMPCEACLNNAGGYTHLLFGGGGFTVAPRPHIHSAPVPKQAPGA